MPDPETGPLRSPGYWLYHAALSWRATLEARLGTFGLTYPQFLLLASVGWLAYRQGTPPRQQDVADLAGLDRMMTSKVVRVLERRLLLARTAHESDARALRLELTEAGRRLTDEATAVARAVDHDMFGSEPEGLRDQLRQLAEQRSR